MVSGINCSLKCLGNAAFIPCAGLADQFGNQLLWPPGASLVAVLLLLLLIELLLVRCWCCWCCWCCCAAVAAAAAAAAAAAIASVAAAAAESSHSIFVFYHERFLRCCDDVSCISMGHLPAPLYRSQVAFQSCCASAFGVATTGQGTGQHWPCFRHVSRD